MKKILSLLMLFVFIISGPLHASIFSSVDMDADSVQDAQKKKDGFLFIKRTLEDLKIDGKEKSLKGVTRIAVPFFRLNFVTSDKYRNSVGGGALSRSTSKVKSSLEGVDPAVYQAVTDEMYTDFTHQLTKAGYEVVPMEEIQKVEKFADMESDYPKIKKSVAQVTAAKMPFPGKFKNAAPEISKELNAVVLQVDLDVDYIIINANAKRFNVLQDKSHVDVTQGVNIQGMITAFVEDKMTTILIQQPVVSKRPFASVNDETSALSKANDVMVLASGWLTQGGIGSKRQTVRDYDVVADSNQYRLAVGDAMVQINRDIAGTLQNLRG